MQVRSLGWEDPLEEGVETLSSILAGRMPRTRHEADALSVDRQDNGPKSVQTETSLLKRLATNAISWDTGRHSALGTQEPQVTSSKPSLTMAR